MVSQAASQTKFRALKHENGIAGNATIIVRVIACFQPLQDCQVIPLDSMGKDCESWFHQQEPPWRKPNLDRPNPMPYLRQPSILAGYTNPYACMVSASGSLPRLVVSESPYLKTGLENELNGWSCSLSRNRQALATNRDLVHNEKKLSGDSLLNSVSGPVQNGLFAYDQIKNQSNMILGSMNDYSIQRLISENQKPFDTMNGSCVEDQASKRDMIYGSENVISSGLDENQETGETESEMHEDTEELDALLYSEGDSEFDDDDDEDDDEISTGHSPCEFTVHHTKKQQQTEGIAEEVASSIGRSKRKRLLEEDEKNSLKDTASSMKLNSARKLEDDAESSCVKGRTVVVEEEESDSVQSNKRLKKEKIRLAVRILQSIIPGGGKGKDAIFVLDEAIHYLRSMKAQN